jgi:hypothetical protein
MMSLLNNEMFSEITMMLYLVVTRDDEKMNF